MILELFEKHFLFWSREDWNQSLIKRSELTMPHPFTQWTRFCSTSPESLRNSHRELLTGPPSWLVREFIIPCLETIASLSNLKSLVWKFMPASLYVTFDERIYPERSAVNSKGEIVAKILGKDTLKIFKRSGESRKLCDVPRKEDARVVEVEVLCDGCRWRR